MWGLCLRYTWTIKNSAFYFYTQCNNTEPAPRSTFHFQGATLFIRGSESLFHCSNLNISWEWIWFFGAGFDWHRSCAGTSKGQRMRRWAWHCFLRISHFECQETWWEARCLQSVPEGKERSSTCQRKSLSTLTALCGSLKLQDEQVLSCKKDDFWNKWKELSRGTLTTIHPSTYSRLLSSEYSLFLFFRSLLYLWCYFLIFHFICLKLVWGMIGLFHF